MKGPSVMGARATVHRASEGDNLHHTLRTCCDAGSKQKGERGNKVQKPESIPASGKKDFRDIDGKTTDVLSDETFSV